MPLRRWKARIPMAPIVDREEFLDVLIIFVTLNMGVWMIADRTLGWEVFITAPLFSVLCRVLPEFWWSAAFLLIGLLHLWGFLREHIETRRAAAFLSFLLWLFVWILIIAGNPHSPTTGAFVANFAGSGAIYLRLRRKGPADVKYRHHQGG